MFICSDSFVHWGGDRLTSYSYANKMWKYSNIWNNLQIWEDYPQKVN